MPVTLILNEVSPSVILPDMLTSSGGEEWVYLSYSFNSQIFISRGTILKELNRKNSTKESNLRRTWTSSRTSRVTINKIWGDLERTGAFYMEEE